MDPLTRREALLLLAAAPLGCGARTTHASQNGVMHTRAIPSSGETLPIIGLGTWQTFDVAQSKPLDSLLTTFVELGGRVVDSSPMYGRAETVLGDAAVASRTRDKLFVATKVWTSGRAAGIAQMESSEKKLRGRVDLMQVHNLVDADAHLETLRAWKAAGRIRYIGITHYTASAYDEVAKFLGRDGIDFVQINYSLAEREAERRILPLAKERNIAVLINRPLGGGSLFRATRNQPLPDFAKEIGCASWSELFLKFVVSHPAVTCAIPATSNPDHLRENMRAGTGAMPDEPIRKRIAGAVR
ncbi:MAG TPA: aldo/keto reductase [Thermoanaerobaculia bacterium]